MFVLILCLVALTNLAIEAIAYSDIVSVALTNSAIEEFASRYSDKVSVTLVNSYMKIVKGPEQAACSASPIPPFSRPAPAAPIATVKLVCAELSTTYSARL